MHENTEEDSATFTTSEKTTPWPLLHIQANKRGGNNTMISVKHKGKNKTSRKIVGLDKGLVFY
jgi:hypothetical protein